MCPAVCRSCGWTRHGARSRCWPRASTARRPTRSRSSGSPGPSGRRAPARSCGCCSRRAAHAPVSSGRSARGYGPFHDPGNGLTTPAPVELHRALRGLRDAGADTAIMEVTSHALLMDRARGLSFGGGLIAAIMPGEHTDFHRTYEDYVAAKRLFLDYLAPGALLAFDADNRVSASLAADARVAVRAGVSLQGPAAPKRARSWREGGADATVHAARDRPRSRRGALRLRPCVRRPPERSTRHGPAEAGRHPRF